MHVSHPALAAAAAAALLAFAAPARAQAPDPGGLPWNAAPAAVRAQIERLGFRAAPAAAGRSDSIFVADRAGVHAEFRARFRGGALVHIFYAAYGDSAAVQRDLDLAAAALTARRGTPVVEGASRVWRLDGGRRFALPAASLRLENGTFGYAVAAEAP